jgi:prolyl-tRNA synthetase
VLLDDRPLRPGAMFSDMELIGIPHRFVISDKLISSDSVEYRGRNDSESITINRASVLDKLR